MIIHNKIVYNLYHSNTNRIVIIILTITTLLTSCIFKTPTPFNNETENISFTTSQLWIKHKQQLEKLTRFKTRGSVIYIDNNQKIYARFFLQQYSLSNYLLSFTNILGTTEFKLVVTAKIAELTNNRTGKKYTFNNLKQLISKLTGISIPVENFNYWLIGLPNNNYVNSFKLNKDGRLITINYIQNSETWKLNYINYSKEYQPILPSCIELTQDTGQEKRLIKLNFYKWILK